MKYSKETVQELCKHIRAGNNNKDSAVLSGISDATFYLWLSDEPRNPLSEEQRLELLDSIKKAEAERKAFLISQIMKASQKTWQASAWYLERRYNDEFGLKQKLDADINANVKVTKDPDIIATAMKTFEAVRDKIKRGNNEDTANSSAT